MVLRAVRFLQHPGIRARLDLLELGPEGVGALLAGVGLSGLGIEMALAFDFGILEGAGPAAELAGAGFGERSQI